METWAPDMCVQGCSRGTEDGVGKPSGESEDFLEDRLDLDSHQEDGKTS